MNYFLIGLLALVAISMAAPAQFTYPKNGDNFVIGKPNNLTWDASSFSLDDTVEFVFEFNSDEISDLLKDSDMANEQRGNCVPLPTNTFPLDLTIPFHEIQKLIDDLNLPIDIDVEWIINNLLANVDAIPIEQRNVTISMFKCGEEEATFRSWITVSSAKQVFVGVLAVLLSVFLVL